MPQYILTKGEMKVLRPWSLMKYRWVYFKILFGV